MSAPSDPARRPDAAAAPDALAARVASALEEGRLWAPDQPLLVGCSGGADSTCLLGLLSTLHAASPGAPPLHAVYVDHGLRPGTDAEAALVAALAERLGATFERLRVSVSRRGNLLAAARRARYQALADCARRRGITRIAVGHTATDQAETVAFRRLRGDPEEAQAGMPTARPLDDGRPEATPLRLLRPLLLASVTRAEAAAWVRLHGLPVAEDPSNEAPRFTRVRLRRQLAGAGALASALLEEAARRGEQLRVDEAAAEALGPLDALDAAAVAGASPSVLLRLLRRAGLYRAGAAQVRALAALASGTSGSACIDLGVPGVGRDPSSRVPGGERLVAERRYRALRIGPATPPPSHDASLAVPVDGPGRYRLHGRTFEVVLLGPAPPPNGPLRVPPTVASAAERPGGPPWSAVAAEPLDGALLDQPLLLRTPRPGDRWRGPLGGRKLSDVLIDHKVPRALRPGLALLCPASGGEVLWVEGVGPSTAARARPASPTRLLLRALSPSEAGADGEAGGG